HLEPCIAALFILYSTDSLCLMVRSARRARLEPWATRWPPSSFETPAFAARMRAPQDEGGASQQSGIFYRVTTTGVPTLTRSNRSRMSWLCMRMQPYETKPPIEPGALVPWIAYWPPESVIAATPIGLCGLPPGITAGSEG